MAVVQTNNENQQKVSLPRRIATYIASMNFTKVFRRHQSREATLSNIKSSERPSLIHQHHRYNRPFSYHIPKTEQLSSPPSLTKLSTIVPYRIGLSSDSTLVTNNQANQNDEIIRLPLKSVKAHKDRRYQSQLNANKRWLFRSMETLDGWKGKVFPQKVRTTNSSQSRSRSVENLTNDNSHNNILLNHNPPTIKQQRAISSNRSIEGITNRVIHGIGIHRKSTNSIPNLTRSPALTIKKQSLSTHLINDHNNERNSSAILDFREISSIGFSQSRTIITDENENISITPSENNNNNNDDENEEVTSNLSFLGNNYEHNGNNEAGDSWDFSITWIDSLKQQQSPQCKIQFYENLIKLLEQDTLNIDELLVLRKVLARIWPTDETTMDCNNQLNSLNSKSLQISNKIKQRSKLPAMAHHTAQRCSTILEQSPVVYETLNEQQSGHTTKPSSTLFTTKAKPCFIENQNDNVNIEQTYPQHLNPFDDTTSIEKIDITPSAPSKELDQNNNNNESIRRYFERLTLLETIYEKLNIESNKTPLETKDHHENCSTQANTTESIPQKHSPVEKQIEIKQDIPNHSHTQSMNKIDTNKTKTNKFFEMNVDGNGSVSSGKSSIKRRAPTAPHITQNDNNHQKNPPMFVLSSADINILHKTNQEISPPIQFLTPNEKYSNTVSPKEKLSSPIDNTTASCDDHGHIFVYEPNLNQNHTHKNEEQSVTIPKKSERIQEWLSSCDTREESDSQNNLSLRNHNTTSPTTQLKIRCMAKPMRYSSPVSPSYAQNHLPSINNEIEPGRFRTSVKINLETNEPIIHPRNRLSSSTSRYYQQLQTIADQDLNITDHKYYQRHAISPSFQRDHQAVYL
ncbi:unnamed protein product [Adineta steineri]|uniref:Uncharacterized protein n=1 Tax=Adineta steineri TaxID=433720 RepID=A0A813XNJ4_9BILA|nr:unnamed protein product [Adineta steineri]CAF3600410.1 unnamed protein product [Adineta steineri]